MWISDEGKPLGFDYETPPEEPATWDDSFMLPEERMGLVGEDESWRPDWYLELLVTLDARENAMDKQHALRKRRIRNTRKWLKLSQDALVERQVKIDWAAQKGRAKSVNYAHGKCGWSKSTRIEVTDEAATLAWAMDNHTDAVKVEMKLTKSALPADKLDAGEIPGVSRVKASKFYARGAK